MTACSFCGRTDDDVAFMIQGPAVQICCECVVMSHGIVIEKLAHMRHATKEASQNCEA
jgi:ATP-dependent protease Clp ATPase subunit